MRKYSDSDLLTAINSSSSISETLSKIGLKPAGGNYRHLKDLISKNQIDTSHFTGQLWNKGKTIGPKRHIEEYLSNRFKISSNNLRKRLLHEHIFDHRCVSCNLTTWLGKPIPLELDHIDGNHANNNILNLRLLCPCCHAMTPTYRGKNIGKSK